MVPGGSRIAQRAVVLAQVRCRDGQSAATGPVTPADAVGSSVTWSTTEDDVDRSVAAITTAWRGLR